MGEEKQKNETSMSLSKVRKLERKKEIERLKRNAVISKVVSICVISLLVIGIGTLIGYKIYRNATKITASNDFSATLDDNGRIEGVDASSLVSLPDYKNATVSKSDIDYSDESVESDIQKILSSHATLDKETDALITEDTKINLDYVGMLDGKAFDGGNTESKGKDYTLGTKAFGEDFDKQLVGLGVAATKTFSVVLPDDYSDSELAGKTVEFDVVINGIYVNPEFNDEFVKTNYSDYASTAEEYRAYVKESKYQQNMTEWIQEYLMENSTVSSYPSAYMKHLKSLQKYQDQYYYDYMCALYAENGYQFYNSFSEYIGMSEAKYDKELTNQVQDIAKQDLIYQAIAEAENITLTADDYMTYLESQGQTSENYDSQVKQYGLPYLLQDLAKLKVVDLIKEHLNIQ